LRCLRRHEGHVRARRQVQRHGARHDEKEDAMARHRMLFAEICRDGSLGEGILEDRLGHLGGGVGKVEKDQAEYNARRKCWTLETAERWLAPILNYNPRKAD
jgi:hypothetical protein